MLAPTHCCFSSFYKLYSKKFSIIGRTGKDAHQGLHSLKTLICYVFSSLMLINLKLCGFQQENSCKQMSFPRSKQFKMQHCTHCFFLCLSPHPSETIMYGWIILDCSVKARPAPWVSQSTISTCQLKLIITEKSTIVRAGGWEVWFQRWGEYLRKKKPQLNNENKQITTLFIY